MNHKIRPYIKTIFNTTCRYKYISLIDKPVYSLALSSISQSTAQLLQFGFNYLEMSPQISCILGGVLFRLGTHIFTSFFSDMKASKSTKFSLNRYIHRIFLVDLERDVKFYALNERQHSKMAKYYQLGNIVKNIANCYLLLNFLRGCHYLIASEQFDHFVTEATTIVPDLGLFDPLFLTPIIIIGLNYLILRNSRHPFLIHLVRPENRIHLFNIAFMSGLIFVPIASVYHFGYMGFALGHLMIRKIIFWKEDLLDYFNNKRLNQNQNTNEKR